MRILVVRRDNIGDLVCTTPLFTALRRRYPQGWIGALVNSYNAPVLERNPDLDEVVAYTKVKHLEDGDGALAALGRRLSSLWKLRRMRLDYVVLATSDFSPKLLRIARLLAPKQVVGFSDGSRAAEALDLSVPIASIVGLHEVERVFALASLFGIQDSIPPLKIVPNPEAVEKARCAFPSGTRRTIAVHISARRPAQRWPAERFAELIGKLHARLGASCMLLWSPGASTHPQHPGDDDKATEIVSRLRGQKGLTLHRTQTLQELIGALAACDAVVCSDGGASHLAAALGKPIVCFFGDSPPERWRPWGVPQRILQPASRRVEDITVEEAASAVASLVK